MPWEGADSEGAVCSFQAVWRPCQCLPAGLCLAPASGLRQGEGRRLLTSSGTGRCCFLKLRHRQAPRSPCLPEPLVLELRPRPPVYKQPQSRWGGAGGPAWSCHTTLATMASLPHRASTQSPAPSSLHTKPCPLALVFVLLCTDLKWIPSWVSAMGQTAVGTCRNNGCAHLQVRGQTWRSSLVSASKAETSVLLGSAHRSVTAGPQVCLAIDVPKSRMGEVWGCVLEAYMGITAQTQVSTQCQGGRLGRVSHSQGRQGVQAGASGVLHKEHSEYSGFP